MCVWYIYRLLGLIERVEVYAPMFSNEETSLIRTHLQGSKLTKTMYAFHPPEKRTLIIRIIMISKVPSYKEYMFLSP